MYVDFPVLMENMMDENGNALPEAKLYNENAAQHPIAIPEGNQAPVTELFHEAETEDREQRRQMGRKPLTALDESFNVTVKATEVKFLT